MRKAFFQSLIELARHDDRIVLLTADLGYSVIEPFQRAFPDRFFNVGVAEQNMVGLAAGLAEAGYLPFIYSIAPFVTARPYEFLRNGPARHGLPVRVVGVGGGFEYGSAGATHHALDDIGLMRMLADMTVLAPADFRQAAETLRQTYDMPGPVYYRIGKDDAYEVPGLNGAFELGRLQVIREGGDALVLSLGSLAREVDSAVEKLSKRDFHCSAAILSCVHPVPFDDLCDAISRVPLAVTVEAHQAAGGIGEMVAGVIAEAGLSCRLVRCCVHRAPQATSGPEIFYLRKHGLDSDSIVQSVRGAKEGIVHAPTVPFHHFADPQSGRPYWESGRRVSAGARWRFGAA